MAKKVQKKTLIILAHCRDSFYMVLRVDGKTTKEYNGYVPSFLGTGGDDVELEIDLATGKITGWAQPTKKQLDKLFKNEDVKT